MSSTETGTLSHNDRQFLCWLLCHERGGTPREISIAFFKQEGRKAEKEQLIKAELDALMQAGLVKRERLAAFVVTPAGKQAALAALRWSKLPGKANWRTVKSRLETCLLEEPAQQLQLPLPQPPSNIPLAGAAGEKAALALSKAFQLDVGPSPAPRQVIDALAWHALGIKTRDPFSRESVIEVLLSRLAGAATRLPLQQAIDKLVMGGAPTTPVTPKQNTPAASLPEDDAAFAARVLEAAKASKTGRFGRDKVFISHVIRQLTQEGVAVGDVEAFKARLVAAHRRDLLSLSRADLVEAMKPEDVDQSETRYLNATFHFVRIG